ncbi:MAG: peptidoglycan recognition protein family protein [Pseudonocardiaceae bacterium]
MQIITRQQWGARHGDGRYDAPLPADTVWLHHSVTIAPDLVPPFGDDDAAIRTIERIGAERFGEVYGFPYTFGITPVGRIYAGHHIAKTGAHTAGHNTAGRAICWVGNYETARPSEAMLAATVWLLRHGHAQGWWRAPRLHGGHRDVKATACPGRHAYALIGEVNRRATQPPEDDDMEPDERDALYDVREQLCGARSSRPPLYPGWPTDVGKLTLVDMVRVLINRQDTLIDRQGVLERKVDELLERSTDAETKE